MDCTSSVLFMPYMAVFKPIYFNSYLIGEGLSGFVPAIFALIQGVGGNPECQEVTKYNETTGESYVVEEPISDPPRSNDSSQLHFSSTINRHQFLRFSVEVFFGLLLLMMVMSAIAFALVDNLKTFDPERVVPVNEDNVSDMYKAVKEQEVERIQQAQADSRTKLAIFLSLITFVCFVSNGALPSIQVRPFESYVGFSN